MKKSPLIKILSLISNKKSGRIHQESRLVRDLKLDSLMRIELVAQIEKQLGVEIDEAKINPQTKVEDLERLIREKPKKEIKFKISSWQLHPLIKLIRKILYKIIAFPVLAIFAPVEVSGQEFLEDLDNPVIFMANHTCTLDSPAVVRVLPSRFKNNIALATATDVLYEHFKWAKDLVILIYNTYPFPRFGQIKSGLDHTQELIDKKWSILFFPEGKESVSGKINQFKRGTGFLAVKMGCPVVPIRIWGAREIIPPHCHFPKKRGKISVKFGKPLYFKKKMTSDEATELIEQAIQGL